MPPVALEMSAWKYRRLMPKVLVSKLRLVQTENILDLVGNPLDQICSRLAKTPYQKDILEIPTQQFSSTLLEEALLKNFIKTVDEIACCSPKGIRALLTAILMKFEADCLKAILRTKSAELEPDQAMKYITPAGRLSAAKCMDIVKNSSSIRDVVKLLSDLEYGHVLEEVLPEYEKTGLLFSLEVAVDRHVYGRIWKAAKKLRGLDGRIARAIVGLEIDSLNIKVILRFKETCVGEDLARQYLMPVSEVFGAAELEGAVRAKEVKSAIEHLLDAAKVSLARDHQHLLMDVMKEYVTHKSMSHLEALLERELLETSLRMLKRYTPFFNVGFVLAFLNLKWFELRNLRTIIRGAEEKMPSARTRELLVLSS